MASSNARSFFKTFILVSLIALTLQQALACLNLKEEPAYFGVVPKCCLQKNFLPSFEINCLKFVFYSHLTCR